jgi:hypothetical protein
MEKKKKSFILSFIYKDIINVFFFFFLLGVGFFFFFFFFFFLFFFFFFYFFFFCIVDWDYVVDEFWDINVFGWVNCDY